MENEYNVCDRADAHKNAWEFSKVLYKNTNKRPFKKLQFIEHLDLAYMMGASNTAKDIYHYIKNNPESDFDTILGDLQLILMKSWNNMQENVIGQATLKKMELEDILYEKPMDDLFKKRPLIKH